MIRKDSEKDSDRPHYYSQFWLDVAAGRRVIGGSKSNEEEDLESEGELAALRKAGGRNNVSAMSDMSYGYTETIAHPEIEPEFEQEEFIEPEFENVEAGDEVEDIVMPDAAIDETEIPDMDFAPVEPVEPVAEEEENDLFEEEEEEEEDLGWGGGRGRKKPKPGRQAKLPAKKPKRERRGF